ncbi:unnamed protein product [Aspergillus oryzae]|nr:unnamed protein product [Aspergillus oryzae]GMF86720.1 unnamed protein product [Aspergillus oryzae]GMG14861.1 unnamed protein product [Aspergillus oryzae]
MRSLSLVSVFTRRKLLELYFHLNRVLASILTCRDPYKSQKLISTRVLLHAPFGGKEGRLGAWRALVEAQKTGKVRSIGVSNYGIHHLNELEEYINSGVGGQISVGQYEIHPWCPREDIVDWLKRRNIVVEAYSPLVQATRMQEPVLQSLVKKHNKTPAQILIRWSLQKSRIIENTQVFDFELSEEDMQSLKTGVDAPVCWDPARDSRL